MRASLLLSHNCVFLLNVKNVGIRFNWSDSEFHNFVPFIETAV